MSSLLSGFYLIAGPFVSAMANRWGFRPVTIIGSIIAAAAFAVSSQANSLSFLYVIYGFIGGIGFSMIYIPGKKQQQQKNSLAFCALFRNDLELIY